MKKGIGGRKKGAEPEWFGLPSDDPKIFWKLLSFWNMNGRDKKFPEAGPYARAAAKFLQSGKETKIWQV